MEHDQAPLHSTIQNTVSQLKDVNAYFAFLRPLLNGIAQTFGRNCEVVLHDFRDPEHSIVAIAGDVTHRHIGGTMSQIGLEIVAQGDAAQDQLNYLIRTQDSRVVRASTLILRDGDGHVFGALCINIDVTELRFLARAIEELAGGPQELPEPMTFGDDPGQLIQAAIKEQELALGHSLDRLTKQERLAIFRALDRRGVFVLQRAVPLVAEYLGLSRATVYSYLAAIREEG